MSKPETNDRFWQSYFARRAASMENLVVTAQGGTLDSAKNLAGKLEPSSHPVSIEATTGLSVIAVNTLFKEHIKFSNALTDLYAWADNLVPHPEWGNVKPKEAQRISSFDSGQEYFLHFLAAAYYFQLQLDAHIEALLVTQGTDTLVHKATLCAVLFARRLYEESQKLVIVGSPESGYVQGSLAADNVATGLFACLESSVPSGVYTVSSQKNREKTSHILPAFGVAKLHADGYFHSPNSGKPPVSIRQGEIEQSVSYQTLMMRHQFTKLLPDFADFYLRDEKNVNRLYDALSGVAFLTVENNPQMLELLYKQGTRAFVIEARGAGNASLQWKESLRSLLNSTDDITVIVTTSADSGDVSLKKYEAGLDIEGLLSGRTLRKEAAIILAGIIHDLHRHAVIDFVEAQHLIELYCFLSGMIDLDSQELMAFTLNDITS